MSSPIKPLGDRVVAKPQEVQTKTASGIYLPDTAKEKPVSALVTAVGSEVSHITVGDAILYKEYSATEVSFAGETHLIIKEEDILATV